MATLQAGGTQVSRKSFYTVAALQTPAQCVCVCAPSAVTAGGAVVTAGDEDIPPKMTKAGASGKRTCDVGPAVMSLRSHVGVSSVSLQPCCCFTWSFLQSHCCCSSWWLLGHAVSRC